MKLNKLVFPIFLLGLVACSEDEIGNSYKWKNEGVVPANFVGCINKAVSSRSTIEGIWEPGNAIGISGSEKYVNCKYVAETEGTDRHFAPATKEDSIYFETSEPISFTAYYPYKGNTGTVAGVITKTITAEDQSEQNQTNIDYLFGTGQGSKASPLVALELEHKMALITFKFVNGYGVDLDQMQDFTVSGVKLGGTFDTSTGIATSTSDIADITINAEQYSGSLYEKSLIFFPQDNLNLNMSANFGTYQVSGAVDKFNKIESGYKYTFTVTVNRGGLVVDVEDGVMWTDDVDESNPTESNSYKVYIPALPQSVDGISDLKLYVDGHEVSEHNNGTWKDVAKGNSIELSFKLAPNKRVNSFDGYPLQGTCKVQFSYTADGVSKCTYSDFASDVKLADFNLSVGNDINVSAAAPQVGNYFYADGTWGSEKEGKDIIGVIFNVGVGAGPGNFWGMNKYSGYVMALTNIDQNANESDYDKDPPTLTTSARCSFGAGYDVNVLGKGTENCVGYFTYLKVKEDEDFATKYTACYKAIDFNTKVNTPTNTSGWYLPSLGEFALFYNVKNSVNDAFKGIDDKALKTDRWFGFYWTLSLSSENKPVFFEPGKTSLIDAMRTDPDPKADPLVRPILTF